MGLEMVQQLKALEGFPKDQTLAPGIYINWLEATYNWSSEGSNSLGVATSELKHKPVSIIPSPSSL